MKYFKKLKWYTFNTFIPILSSNTIEEGFEKSIEKWELLSKDKVLLPNYTSSIYKCGLCDIYAFNKCKGCPILIFTGFPYCENFKSFVEHSNSKTKFERKKWAKKVLEDIKELQNKYFNVEEFDAQN